YSHATNSYPYVSDLNNQYKLYDALTPTSDPSRRLQILNFNGELVKTYTEPFLNVEEMLEDGFIIPIDSGFGFSDAWGNPIRYFYGELSSGANRHPYYLRAALSIYNLNWLFQKFDLISYGVNGLSDEGNPNQQDDITNFN
ncbi:hypothetical protein BVX93_00745, partial [bacterium B13(2017)]